MSTDAEAADAISKFNGAQYEGRALTVNEAKPQAPRENRGGSGGRRY
jgi:cold-inducible RNA-binding protein